MSEADICTYDPMKNLDPAHRAGEISQARRRPVTARRLAKAIRAVVEYNWSDERDDFLYAEHTAPLREHIFGSLVVLDQFLCGTRR